MMKHQFNFQKEKNYFLVPEMPTPNGRMHLGHIAGPYLKMDILRRKTQRGGGTAFLISGSDVFESYVELKASQLQLSTEEICNTYHDLIKKDFEALHIHFDDFINPLDEKWKDRFVLRERELMQLLTNAGVVEEREETFIYDGKQKRFLNGCWINGICPSCGNSTGSYLCESCGTHYGPSDIFNHVDYPGVTLVKGTSLYLKLDTEKLFDKVNRMGISEDFSDILKKYIELQGPYIRMTTPQQTGVEWQWGTKEKQVLFTYSALLFFSIFCADICAERFNLPVHPFDPESDFITIASFGIDNAVPYLAGVLAGGMELPGLKSFDYYFSNYFYHLNGAKFSTSRLHVIWGSDIVNVANVQSDAVRYYLAKQNPEFEKKNFDVDDFINTVNEDLHNRYNQAIKSALDTLSASVIAEPDEVWCVQFEHFVIQQNKFLEPPLLNMAAAVLLLEEWAKVYEDSDDSEREKYGYWWLKGFAFLAFPFMPEISTDLWKILSGTSEINVFNFFSENGTQYKSTFMNFFREINYEQMEACLPVGLRKEKTKNN